MMYICKRENRCWIRNLLLASFLLLVPSFTSLILKNLNLVKFWRKLFVLNNLPLMLMVRMDRSGRSCMYLLSCCLDKKFHPRWWFEETRFYNWELSQNELIWWKQLFIFPIFLWCVCVCIYILRDKKQHWY